MVIMIALMPAAFADATKKDVPDVVNHKSYGVLKILFPIRENKQKDFVEKLINAENTYTAIHQYGGKATIKFLMYSSGVKLFVNPNPELAAAIDTARDDGVHFLFCNNTMKTLKIHSSDLYFVNKKNLIPAGIPEIAYLENKGYKAIY